MHLPSAPELLVIALVALFLLGPDKLPQVSRQVGGLWRSFREQQQRLETQVRDAMPNLPSTTEMARMARSPVSLLNKLADFDVAAETVQPDPGAMPPPHSDHFPSDPAAPGVASPSPANPSPSTPTPAADAGFGDPNLN